MTNWLRNLWSRQSVLAQQGWGRRASRGVLRTCWGSEELEPRTLLSGQGLAGSTVAAEVAPHHAKAKFTPPDVAGSWTVTAANGQGTISFTQDGANVTYTGSSDSFPTFTGDAKFKAKHVNAIVDHAKVQTEAGKQKVTLVITFAPNNPEPQTFTGQILIGKQPSIAISGVKDA